MSDDSEKKDDEKKEKSFWLTLPGVLTAIAALISAIGGLLIALSTAGLLKAPPTPTVVADITPLPTASPTFAQTPTTPPTPTPTPTTPPTPTPIPTAPPTFTPTPTSTPAFITSWILYDPSHPDETGIFVQTLELEVEPGILPTETITDVIRLSRVTLGDIEYNNDEGTRRSGFNITILIKNTGSEPLVLDLDQRFFSLEDEQGRAAPIVYYCCTAHGDLLASGQQREIQLIFEAVPEWFSKERGVSAVFLRVRGLLPVIRASWAVWLPRTMD